MEKKLSKWVKNTVGKGEISRYERFLLFPQCFQKACFPGASKGVIVWEWVKKDIGTAMCINILFMGTCGNILANIVGNIVAKNISSYIMI